jgi:hypothetical protein
MTRLHQALELAEKLDRQDQALVPRSSPRCPKCGREHEGSLRGPWLTRFFRLIRTAPYRCEFCRERFSAREEAPTGHIGWGVSPFLRPADNRTFEDVLRDLARDEREKHQQDAESEESDGTDRIREFEPRKLAGRPRRPSNSAAQLDASDSAPPVEK